MLILIGFDNLTVVYNLVITIQNKIQNISVLSKNAFSKREVLPIFLFEFFLFLAFFIYFGWESCQIRILQIYFFPDL